MLPVTLLLVHTGKDQEWSASEAMSSTVNESRSHLSIPISSQPTRSLQLSEYWRSYQKNRIVCTVVYKFDEKSTTSV